MWRQVVVQAFIDVTKDTSKLTTPSQRRKAELVKQGATNWFLDSYGVTATDFMEVCNSALLNHHAIRERVRKAIESGETFSYLTIDDDLPED